MSNRTAIANGADLVQQQAASDGNAVQAAHKAVEVVEAALGRRFAVAHMPFAGGSRAIAGGLEHLRDGHAVRVQRPAIAGELLTFIARAGKFCGLIGSHQPDARLMRIKSREQRRTRGAAERAGIELREAQPSRRERVEIRRADLAPVAPEVRPAEIVGEDDEDVRLVSSSVQRSQRNQHQGGDERDDAYHCFAFLFLFFSGVASAVLVRGEGY